jgi:hypothetical protein
MKIVVVLFDAIEIHREQSRFLFSTENISVE